MVNKMKLSKITNDFCLTVFALTIALLTVVGAQAQTDSVEKVRLKNPAAVKGTVGGESHDGYVIRVRKNQTLKIQISWQAAEDNKAQFVVSRSADFFAGDVLEGGTETYDGKNRTVKIPATGDYYIYVTGHPTVNYTLKVSVK